MTEQELRAAIAAKWGLEVFCRQRTGEGVHPEKRILECGKDIPQTKRHRAYTESVSFDAASIPEDAIEKIESILT